MKYCRLCEETKPLNEFPTRKGSKDGLRNECRECLGHFKDDTELMLRAVNYIRGDL